MFGSNKPKKSVHFTDTQPGEGPAASSSPDKWVATLLDPPASLPAQPYHHPHSYSLPFASSNPHPDPFCNPPPAKRPEGGLYYFAPLGPGTGDVRGYLGRPTPVGGEKEKGKEKEDKPKEDKALEPEKQRAKAWDDYHRALAAQGYYHHQQQQQQARQVVAPAPKPAGEAAGGGGAKGGGGSDANLLPKIGYYVPPGTTEGALLATWPGGVPPGERSRTFMHAIYDG